MKFGKRLLTDGMKLPNQDKIRTLGENETYKYLGFLEADTIKQVKTKDKIQKEYLRRTRKLHETKLSSRNLIKGINTWGVPLVRYYGAFLKWTAKSTILQILLFIYFFVVVDYYKDWSSGRNYVVHSQSLYIRLFNIISRTHYRENHENLWRGKHSYPSAVMQSVYSTAPACNFCICIFEIIDLKSLLCSFQDFFWNFAYDNFQPATKNLKDQNPE